jgi:predicted methyltransferase
VTTVRTNFRIWFLIPVAFVPLSAIGQHAAPSAEDAAAEEQRVQEGINERFVDPGLDTTRAAQGFENENREVYARRHDVLEALNLAPGMVVADVGAGSGFYTELMAAEVGPNGVVYAVEIAPNWIQYLNELATSNDLDNVVVIRGGERSVGLPDDSVDLVFASDTYHHFEYPQSSLASIRQALKPGGRWVVLDYDRIPGVTPPNRMNHLRIGKAEAIAEIEAAGFILEQDIDLNFAENYLAIFRRL